MQTIRVSTREHAILLRKDEQKGYKECAHEQGRERKIVRRGGRGGAGGVGGRRRGRKLFRY